MNKKQASLNRQKALEMGAKTYFGQTCRRGHSKGERYTSSRECLACTPLRAAAWFKENPEAASEAQRRWYEKNQEKKTAYTRSWNKENPHFARYNNTNRRARKLNATPPWLTKKQQKEIREIYRLCPDNMEVDHIYPLTHPNCCGLHVPWNLQYLTSKANRQKSNKLPEISPSCIL